MVFDGLVVDQWFEQKIAQTANASAMQDRSAMQEDPNHYRRVLYHLTYVPSPIPGKVKSMNKKMDFLFPSLVLGINKIRQGLVRSLSG